MIDRLVVAGLVIRKFSEDDKRIKLVIVTRADLELYRQIEIEMDLMHQESLATISRDALLEVTEALESIQGISQSLA